MTINQIIEERAASDLGYRRLMQRNGKRTLSDGRRMSDAALVEKLRDLGVAEFDRAWFDRHARSFDSVQTLTKTVTASWSISDKDFDWIWIALVCLWERWFPDRPNFEMVEDQLLAGFQLHDDEQLEAAALVWGRAWEGIVRLMEASRTDCFEDLSGWHRQAVTEWLENYSSLLSRLARSDRRYANERVQFCELVCKLTEESEEFDWLFESFHENLTEALAEAGDLQQADERCEARLKEHPQAAWDWIHWSDLYGFDALPENLDPAKAERILQRGLDVADIDDRQFILDRLYLLYDEEGRTEEAAAVQEELGPERAAVLADGGPMNADEWKVDEIIAELDRPLGRGVPVTAIAAARERQSEIVPRLVELLRDKVAHANSVRHTRKDGDLYALALLIEFGAVEALPAVLELLRLPERVLREIAPDPVFDVIPPGLVALGATANDLDTLIGDHRLHSRMRWSTADAYLFLVRDDKITRQDAVGQLHSHLKAAMERGDSADVTSLILTLADLGPHEARLDILDAIEQQLFDPELLEPLSVDAVVFAGETHMHRCLRSLPESGIKDAVKVLEFWDREPLARELGSLHSPGLLSPPPAADSWADELDADDFPEADVSEPVTTLHTAHTKVGRNEPCPCGSGKKFKKCCGRS
jgi:hypothetical protein